MESLEQAQDYRFRRNKLSIEDKIEALEAKRSQIDSFINEKVPEFSSLKKRDLKYITKNKKKLVSQITKWIESQSEKENDELQSDPNDEYEQVDYVFQNFSRYQ